MDFDQFTVDSPRYYRITQRVFRELDEQVLAMALSALPESVREFMFKNVTDNTAAILREDIARFEAEAGEDQKEAAVATVYDMYERVAEELADYEPKPQQNKIRVTFPEELVVRVDTKPEIVKTIVSIAELARTQGLLALDEINSGTEFLQTGLQLVADGCDPEVVHTVLDRTRTTLLREFEDKLTMMMEGLEAIQVGENPKLIERRLEAFLSG